MFCKVYGKVKFAVRKSREFNQNLKLENSNPSKNYDEDKNKTPKNKNKIREEKISWIGILSLVGGFLVQLTLGSYYSFANLMPYMVSYMRKCSHESSTRLITYGDFIIVQSAWGITQGLVLPIGGALIASIGSKAAVITGSILFSISPLLTAATIRTNLMSVVMSFGVLSAVGQNLSILPTLMLPMAWFPERKGLVSGIVVSGFGVGAFVFNQIQTKIANPTDLPVVKNGSINDGYFVQDDVIQRVPLLLHLMGFIYGGLLAVGSFLLLSTEKKRNDKEEVREEHSSMNNNKKVEIFSIQKRYQIKDNKSLTSGPLSIINNKNNNSNNTINNNKNKNYSCSGEDKKKRPGNLESVKTILKSKEFYLLWTTRFGMVLISQCLSGFYKAFALEELSYNDEFISTVGAVAGIFNCVGRISMGFLVDKYSYRFLMSLEAILIFILLSSFYWVSQWSPMAFAVNLWLCYLCLPGAFAMHPAVCSRIFGPKLDSLAIGMIGSSDVANNLLIGIFSDILLANFGWNGYFMSVASLAILVFFVTCFFPPNSKQMKHKSNNKKLMPVSEGHALEDGHGKFGAIPLTAVLY